MFAIAISAALGNVSNVCTIMQVDNIIVPVEFRETNPVQTYIIRMGIKNLYNLITSRYSDFDITPIFFSYIISGVRNLNNGPCFVKSVNNRSVVCQEIRE